ncbi:MFS transporter [Mucilaginibacter robiniae]|uniref:MFS transporter n=1 Tax=Mucilaginibacter robiniae TaxID=2728022 RepID=A0A7L5E2T0_9SPHI|nr:MFS transporter [Mucilaginibacter robiniae]QJD97435.1 MFS transporter [Mucilaginibacter robiniae]
MANNTNSLASTISTTPYRYSKEVLRAAVGAIFFLPGLIFASWASRIATIQQSLNLSDTALGAILFSIPVGLMLSLPFAGWMISKVGSRKLAIAALILYSVALIGLGAAPNIPLLIACMVAYGFASNSANIAVNTQAVATEKMYNRPILASFHGLWSLAGFAGAGIGTFMIASNILPVQHFTVIAILVIIGLLISVRYLLDDHTPADDSPMFVLPDRSLIKLGIIAFCSLICEGAMFDWSVIYFKKVVHAQNAWMAAGYTCAMGTMALGRFVADGFAHRFGVKRTLQVSGILTASGIFIAILFPYLLPAMVGFLLVGAGVSSVVPMVYSLAGRSTTMSPGMALAAVSTIGFVGFLVGPPVIGFLSGAFNLRIALILVMVMGCSVAAISTKIKF